MTDNSTRDWLAFALPNAAAYLETALGAEGMVHLESVIERATAAALNRAEANLEHQARAAAADARTKESAYSAGFRAGAQANAVAVGRLEGLQQTTQTLMESAALASMDRCMAVFASLAGDDPRLSLAAKLITSSTMSAEEIVATAQSIPDSNQGANGWLSFMRQYHAIGAPGSAVAANGNEEPTVEEKKAAFTESLGLTKGQKIKGNLA